MRYRRLILLPVILALCALLSEVIALAQEQAPQASIPQAEEESPATRKTPPPIPEMQKPVSMRANPSLAAGTRIPLVLTREVKVKEARAGDTADFVLSRDLWYRDTLLAPHGTPVQVVVQTAAKAKWLSRGSMLGFDIQSLKLLNGSLVPLRGDAHYKGGINSVSGGAFSANAPGGDTGALVGGAAMMVGVFGLIAPGKNQNAKPGAQADAWVAEDYPLDMGSLLPLQPPRGPMATGRVQVVRGNWERLKRRDFYCNGVALAHLGAKRKYVADLKPGWYRFAIHPAIPPVQIFVVPGEVYTLVARPDSIRLDWDFSGGATVKPELRIRTEKYIQELVSKAKPVDRADLYGDVPQCAPLAEEVVPAAAPAGSAASADEKPVPTVHD